MGRDELQLAEVKLVRLRQELEQKYGHYNQLRRTATGVLQAIDLSLVSSKIVKSVTEELMITTPDYWLAPALVALTGWLHDRRQLAERALEEAVRRNPRKTALFFALVSRRYKRQIACRSWFEYYFEQIDPQKIDRDMIVVIDGITNGVFPLAVTNAFIAKSQEWFHELAEFKEEERALWRDSLFQRVDYPLVEEKYPHLSKNSLTWDEVSYSAQIVNYYGEIATYVKDILTKAEQPSPHIEAAIDQLLEKLVFQYEDDELRLRQEEREMEIIIEENGDRVEAMSRMEKESELFSPHYHYLELLRNIAMYPETLGVSPLAQRYAIAVLKQVILDTHQDLTASIRKQIPDTIVLTAPSNIREVDLMENWVFETKDGSEMQQCQQSVKEALKKSNKRQLKKMWKIRLSMDYLQKNITKAVLAGIVGIVLLIYSPIAFAVATVVGVIAYKWWREKPFYDQIKEVEAYVNAEMEATMADVVDFRDAYTRAEQQSEELPKLIKSLSAHEVLQRNYDKTRVIIR
jgi:hypothetical protein